MKYVIKKKIDGKLHLGQKYIIMKKIKNIIWFLIMMERTEIKNDGL